MRVEHKCSHPQPPNYLLIDSLYLAIVLVLTVLDSPYLTHQKDQISCFLSNRSHICVVFKTIIRKWAGLKHLRYRRINKKP